MPIDIYNAGKNFRKGKAYAPMNPMPDVSNLAFTPYKKEHGRRRRIIGQGFMDAAMREANSIIKGHIMELCDCLLEAEDSIDPEECQNLYSSDRGLDRSNKLFTLELVI